MDAFCENKKYKLDVVTGIILMTLVIVLMVAIPVTLLYLLCFVELLLMKIVCPCDEYDIHALFSGTFGLSCLSMLLFGWKRECTEKNKCDTSFTLDWKQVVLSSLTMLMFMKYAKYDSN